MSPIASHPFLRLDESERVNWIARFLDDPGAEAPYDLPFPILRREEQPFTWLIDQFRRVRNTKDLPDRIRRPVLALLLTQAGRGLVSRREQVLGELLEVVGACGFTDKEIVEALRGWMRDDLYRDAKYEVFGNSMTIRGKIWSLLIGWCQSEGLVDALRRDFLRSELDCSQLCFVELGRLSPEDAIDLIPKVFAWPEPYWREVLRRFFTSLGARQVTTERYKPAWERCFAQIIWSSKFIILETKEEGSSQVGPFARLLQEVGLLYSRSGIVVYLQPMEPGAPGLKIDYERFVTLYTEEWTQARWSSTSSPSR